uniref:Uncharacterized protein n=1 Tax=Avena sativa TaxID=4498 RepID=A0ACD5TB83_AVESA
MLHLRAYVASHILSSPSTSAISTLRRLISAAAPAISPHPRFAVDDYLVDTCGLTRAQALRASTKLSHFKSRAKPDAVLAFLADLGLSSTAVAAIVATDPKFLCAGVDRTLAPVVAGLTELGLSRSEVTRLVSLHPSHFRRRSIVSSLQYYLPLFGSSGNLLLALERSTYLVGSNLEKVVKPNVLFLRQCGLMDSDIAKICVSRSRILTAKPGRVQAMVACAESIGVPRGSGMFMRALRAVAFLSEDYIATKVKYLKKIFRWSDAEVRHAVSKYPYVVPSAEDMLQRKSEFLISEMGLEPAYIAHRPIMISLSIEGRLRPRYYVLKFLEVNGLLDQNPDYYYVFKMREEVFVKKFICPHKEAAPHLAQDYAATCKGEVPTNFRFT